MEPFNEKDGLDKFLRNTFDGAEDTPSNDLWDRIATDLDTPEDTKRPVIVWWLGGAVVVLLGLLVFQHFYYQNKVKAAQTVVANQEIQDQQEVEKPFEKNTTNEEKLEVNQSTESDNSRQENLRLESNENLTPKTSDFNSQMKIKEERAGKPAQIGKSGEKLPPFASEIQSASKASENVEESASKISPTTEVEETVNTMANANQTIVEAGNFLSKVQSSVDVLGDTEWPVFINNDQTLAKYTTVISPFKAANTHAKNAVGWEVGAMTQFANTNLSLSAESILRPINRALSIRLEQESGRTQWHGVQVKAVFNDRFHVQSGLAYQQTDLVISHKSSINYGERLRNIPPDWPGRDSTLSDYRYRIPTTSGVYEVTVRASDVEQRRPLPDTEILLFNQVIAERTTFLSIPFAVGYQQPLGKWSLSGNAGIWTNFLLKNEVSLERIESLNRRFMVSRRLARPQFAKADLRQVTLDYTLSAQASYDVLPGLSIYAGPVWVGSIVQKNKNALIQSSLESLGMTGGFFVKF